MKGCFCHFNGFEVKDATARKSIEELRKNVNDAINNAQQQTEEALQAERAALEAQYGTHEKDGCYSRIYDGSIEFINPPMLPGNEYRTTERYDGLPVYTKLIEWEDTADFSGDPFVVIDSHPINARVISIEAVVIDPGATYPISMFYNRAFVHTSIGENTGITHIKFLNDYEHEDERVFSIKLKYVKP